MVLHMNALVGSAAHEELLSVKDADTAVVRACAARRRGAAAARGLGSTKDRPTRKDRHLVAPSSASQPTVLLLRSCCYTRGMIAFKAGGSAVPTEMTASVECR